MTGMFMIMGAVVSSMFMRMGVFRSVVTVGVFVFMDMPMGMGVGVRVGVLADARMLVFMLMLVSMLVGMLVLVFVVALHSASFVSSKIYPAGIL